MNIFKTIQTIIKIPFFIVWAPIVIVVYGSAAAMMLLFISDDWQEYKEDLKEVTRGLAFLRL